MLPTISKVMKYLLFLFNFVFVLTGIILITVGIIIRSSNEEYKPIMSDEYITAPNLLILMGFFVFCVAFFGCCGALRESYCMLFTFSVIMSAIFVAEVAIGVTGYMQQSEATDLVTKGLNQTMVKYNTTEDITQFWDNLQEGLTCCGTKNYTDWLTILHSLPMSCCTPKAGIIGVTSCTTDSKYLHKTPCIVAVGDTIRDNASTIGITGITIAAIQLLGVIFSCSLAHSIRNDYESV